MKIHNIPGKLEVTWREDVKAIVDTWTSYFVTMEDFKEAVLIKGLNHAKENGGIAWIVDSSIAKGAFSQEIQDFIGTDLFPAFQKNGIKYFITINSNVSAITKMTVNEYSFKTALSGLKLIEINSIDEAITCLKNLS